MVFKNLSDFNILEDTHISILLNQKKHDWVLSTCDQIEDWERVVFVGHILSYFFGAFFLEW